MLNPDDRCALCGNTATAEPAELVRPARTVVIRLGCHGAAWLATSPQLDGFYAWGSSREAAADAAREKLAGWLDPAVTMEFEEKP